MLMFSLTYGASPAVNYYYYYYYVPEYKIWAKILQLFHHHCHLFWNRQLSSKLSWGWKFVPGKTANCWWHFTRVNSTTSGPVSYLFVGIGVSLLWPDPLHDVNQLRIMEEMLESGNHFSGSSISAPRTCPSKSIQRIEQQDKFITGMLTYFSCSKTLIRSSAITCIVGNW